MREPGQALRAAEYAPRRPETTVLYGVVQHHVETWLRNARLQDRAVPRFVERELRAFLDCGIRDNGFLRLHCDAYGLDRVVAFSCKGRGFCPSCGGRWRAKQGPSGRGPIWQCVFRCEKCRLVSSDARVTDDERHARIGEYRESERAKA